MGNNLTGLYHTCQDEEQKVKRFYKDEELALFKLNDPNRIIVDTKSIFALSSINPESVEYIKEYNCRDGNIIDLTVCLTTLSLTHQLIQYVEQK